jgi:Major Facilitator Superfamily.
MQQLTLVEPILFGYMFCLYTTMPLEQQLVYQKTCLQTFNSSYCHILYTSKEEMYKEDQNSVQEKASEWQIYFNVVRTAPAIISTLIFTGWFDITGRKRVMIMPMIGGALSTIIMIINSHFINWSVAFMMIGTFLEGLFGQFAAILASVFAYLADVTTVEARTKRTVLLESMIYLGGVTANCISGVLLQYYGFVPPFVLILAMYVFQIIYWFFLRESYPPKSDQPKSSLGHILRGKLFIRAFTVVFKKREDNRRRIILVSFFLFVLGIFCKYICLYIYVLKWVWTF